MAESHSPSDTGSSVKAGYKQEVGVNRRKLLERTATVWMLLQLFVYSCRLMVTGLEGASLIAAACLITTAAVLLLSRRGFSARILSKVLLLSITLPIMALSYYYDGIHSPFLILIVFIPVAAFMLVSRPAGWVATAIVCTYFVVLGLLDLRGYPWPIHDLDTQQLSIATTASFVLVMCCISGIGWYYSRMYDAFYFSMKRSNQELKRTAQYKSQFLSNMSHEFRTPLNSIIGFSRRLERNLREKLDERDINGLQAILRNGENMQVLVDDVLDMAKIEAGEVSAKLEQVDVSKTVRQVVTNFKDKAQEKGLTLGLELGQSCCQFRYKTDAEKLSQVLTNLLSNAVKYTDDGSIVLSLGEKSDRPGIYVISVTDTGRGICEQDIGSLFNQFSRSKTVERSNIVGSGLGLALTNELVKLLHGKITVDSDMGKGTTFSVYLPV
ncbi:Signal transduction histidine kinase [Alteromonadaceae bacterium Bs31]|nr:Signal transduction histidine kinase [Alteromonadaceae bacterium Bs31]